MQKVIAFQLEDVVEIPDWTTEYPEHKFTVFKGCFLSSSKNSHGLNISGDVLKKYASTILGSFLVAKVEFGDAKSHEQDEIIYGYAPREQEVEFVEKNNIVKAYCYFVVSKRYSKEFNDIFEFDNIRNSSVEMTVETSEEEESNVLSFDIYGLTCLNRTINGSCPDADIRMVRFSEEDAKAYFNKNGGLTSLKKFVQERKTNMADEKYASHPVNTSKDAVYDGEWDGNKAKQDLIKEKNFKTLAPKVCLRLEDGWEDREVTKLGYPVMGLYDGEWRYSKKGLASAKGYAEKENEEEVLSKVEKIYKKLGLDYEGKEEDAKMNKEIKFAAVDIGDLWGKLFGALHSKYPNGDWGSVYRIDGIYEEDNKKFTIIRHKNEDAKYRLDFSLTEEGLTLAEEIVKVEIEFTETDEIRKFAEPENAEKYKVFEEADSDDEDDDEEAKMSVEEMTAKISEMQADIESRDNIIMEKDAELEELRKFKSDIEDKEKALFVEAVMSDVKECLEEVKFTELRDEGMACTLETVDAWSNKVKAVAFSAVKKPNKQKSSGIFEFAAPINTQKPKSNSVWDRLKEQI